MSTIIFDFDGTISNSFPYVSNFLIIEAGLETEDKERVEQLKGLSMQAMALNLGFSWWRLPDLFIRGRRRMRASSKLLQPYEDMAELIRQLHEEGHQLYLLSSNNSRNIRIFLEAHELDSYFIKIYGSIGMFSKAPALRRLLKKHNIETTDAVYVGDEMRDLVAAQSIGLRAISVTWGFARRGELGALKPTALVDTPAELAVALKKI